MRPEARTSLAWFGLALIVLGLVPAAWALVQLAEGAKEIPQHWWSSMAALPLFLGIVTTAAGLVRSGRADG